MLVCLCVCVCVCTCDIHHPSYRSKAAGVTDRRVKVMNEVIAGIRVIKMYAWEYAFKRVVSELRRSSDARFYVTIATLSPVRYQSPGMVSVTEYYPPIIMLLTKISVMHK